MTAPTGSRAQIPQWVIAVAAAGLSGLMLAACYWPLNWHLVAWIGLIPWFFVLPKLSPAKAWVLGTLLGLVFYRIGLSWLFRIHGPLAGICITVLAIWMGFSFRVARLLIERFSPAAMLWALPLTFVGQEVLRCEALPRLRFPFLALGYSQSANLWTAQLASLGGVYGLSGAIVLVNAAGAYALRARTKQAGALAVPVMAALAAATWCCQPAGRVDLPRIAVACVQAETYKMEVFTNLAGQALETSPTPRLVVLPEHTLVDYPDARSPRVRALAAAAGPKQACICVGAHTSAPKGAECPYDNVAMLIGPGGEILGMQAKCVPLPFFQDGNPARTQAPVDSPAGRLGMLVCYDALFTDHARRLVQQGAELLVVPVMDVDNWPDQEREQHAAMAPMRSIELQRCAVRAASSGISQIVDATGAVTARRTHQEGFGVLTGSVGLPTEKTVFVRGGYLLAPAAGGLFVIAVMGLTIGQWIRRVRQLRRSA